MHKYVVRSTEQITPSTLLLTLKSDETGPPFAFQPGQYAVINYYRKRRPSVVRCFSIVSSPTEQGILQFSMRTRGHFTKALTRLKPGDKVDIRGPYGGFVFNSERDKRTVFLAGGIGITPFMSMASYAAAMGSDSRIDLLYSCQTQDDVPFSEELKLLEKANPNFRTTFVIADGPVDKLEGCHTAQGRITPELISQILPEGVVGTTFLICGPPPFMKAMTGVLISRGVQNDYILTEAFSQGPNRQTGKVKNWPVNMYILSGVGLAMASLTIMVADLLKALPPSTIFGTNNNIRRETLASSRQTDLDTMVNSLPAVTATAPASDKVLEALAAASVQQVQPQKGTTSLPPKTVTSSTTPTPTTTPTPSPAPTPTCITTQSGVKICT